MPPDWQKACCRNQREQCCGKTFHSLLKGCWCERKKLPYNMNVRNIYQTSPTSLKVGLNVYMLERAVTKPNEPAI